MSFTGMDIGGVRTLATQMDHSADNIQTQMSQLTASLQSTQWVGPDHDHFVSEWQSTHCHQLQNVVNSLKEAANKARLNATQQEQASNA